MAYQLFIKGFQEFAKKQIQEIGKEIGKNIKEDLKEKFREGIEKAQKEVESLKNSEGKEGHHKLSPEVKGFQEVLDHLVNKLEELSDSLKDVLPEDVNEYLNKAKETLKDISEHLTKIEENFNSNEKFTSNEGIDYIFSQDFKIKVEYCIKKFNAIMEDLPDQYEPEDVTDEDFEEFDDEEN